MCEIVKPRFLRNMRNILRLGEGIIIHGLSSLVAVLKVDLVFSLLQELLAASPRRDMFFCSRQWLFATSSLVSGQISFIVNLVNKFY